MKKQNKDKMKWVAVGLAGVILAGACATTIAMGVKNNGWFQNPDSEQTQPETPDKGGAVVNPDETTASSGRIRLTSAKIATVDYEEYGIAPQSDSAYSVTATVGPEDADNDVLDWFVAWNNADSEWATGKTVTDYVTITPTSDGALTATLSCSQAFGEQVVLTAAIRDDEAVCATATVDYMRKIVGANFYVNAPYAATTWDIKHEETDVTVDYMTIKSEFASANLQTWVLGYSSESNTTSRFDTTFGDVYTLDAEVATQTVSFAPTSEYLSALTAAGFTVTATAGTYYTFPDSSAPSYTKEVAFGCFLLNRYVSNFSTLTNTKVATLRNNLKTNADKKMFDVKIETTDTAGNVYTTNYTLKFTASSLSTRASTVTMQDSFVF